MIGPSGYVILSPLASDIFDRNFRYIDSGVFFYYFLGGWVDVFLGREGALGTGSKRYLALMLISVCLFISSTLCSNLEKSISYSGDMCL